MRFLSVIFFFFIAPVIAGCLSQWISSYEEFFRKIVGFQPSTTGGGPTGIGGFLIVFVPILFLHILFVGLRWALQGKIQSRINHYLFIFLFSIVINVGVGCLLFRPGVDQFELAVLAAAFLFCIPLFIGECLAYEIQILATKRS